MLQVDQTASINTHTTYSDFVPLGAAATGILLMTGFRALRQWIIWRDGIADEDEKEWEFETARIENDGHSLCCSFLIVQVWRYYVGGVMPDPAGSEQNEKNMHGQIVSFHKHSVIQIEELLGLAVMAKLLAIGMSFWPEAKPTFGHWFEWIKYDGRLLVISTLSKTSGWLLNFAACWIVASGAS